MPSVADKLIQQGREEGLKEASKIKLEKFRKIWVKGILKLLQSKFQIIPLTLQEKITTVRDLVALETLFDYTIESTSLDQFEKQFESILQ